MDQAEPDIAVFAQLYGCGTNAEVEADDAQPPITRRMAYYLWLTATVLGDEWSMFARDFEEYGDLWRDLLPPVAERWATQEWLARFAQCFKDVADRLSSGTFTDSGVALCTGDEVAVALVLHFARDLLADGELELPERFDELLERCGDADEDFTSVHDFLTADADVELLWDMSLDGIENDDTSGIQTVNLHPRDWFLPFG